MITKDKYPPCDYCGDETMHHRQEGGPHACKKTECQEFAKEQEQIAFEQDEYHRYGPGSPLGHA